MTVLANSRGAIGSRRPKTTLAARTKRRKRQFILEGLESRTLLAYTFTYNPVMHIATAQGTAAVDSLVITPMGGNLEHSVNGGPFDPNWTGFMVPAAITETVNVNLSTNDGSSFQMGGGGLGPASALFAAFKVVAPVNMTDTATIDDSTGTTLASPYTIDTGPGFIFGPGINYDQAASAAFQGGVTLKGSPVNGNIYNVLSVCCSSANHEPMTVKTAAGTASTVNVGSGGTLTINSKLAIFDPGDATTININDAADTTHSTATLDNLSGNVNAPFEVTGLSAAPIEYGLGVTALNINGGTFGATGVNYDVNNTQAGTTTTINGGPNKNTYNLSNLGEVGGLSNLPGPVVINGGGAGDAVTATDFDNIASDNYTLTGATVTSTGAFGGLTYGGLGAGSLTLYASGASNVIDVNSTANGVVTNVYGDAGVDTINVNGTGTGGPLSVLTGDFTAQATTVNVLANSEPVNISSFANSPIITTVNIGSTGGLGSMAGIQGPISVVNGLSHTALNFHDENDATVQTWTLNNDDSVPTGSVAVTGSATTTYNPAELSELTVNGGSGGNTFDVFDTSAFYITTLNTGMGADTVDVLAASTFAPTGTLNIHGQAGLDTVTLGADPVVGMQNLFGTINVENAASFTTLILDDSQDTTGRTALLTNNGTTGTVTGLSPATINYIDADIKTLTVDGSNAGGNTFNVHNTFANLFTVPTVTTINKGTGGFNTVNVFGTAAGSALDLTGGAGTGTDTVDIGAGGSIANILGLVNVQEVPGSTNLILDLSGDGLAHTFDLSSDGTTSTLHDELGNLPKDLTYTTAALASLTINTDPAFNQILNLSFAGGGNPIPTAGAAGLVFNADGTSGATASPGVTHALNIAGQLPSGPFASETHNANDETVFPQVNQYGSIFFTDAGGINTGLDYTGLQPITDIAPAVLYTFNDDGFPDQSFSATFPGILIPGSIEFTNTPSPPTPTNFETTDITSKTNVVFNTPPKVANSPGPGLTGTVNIPTAYAGLESLTFNTPTNGDNTVSFIATPPGVVTSLNGGLDEDVTNVTGPGVAAGTVLFLNGGNGGAKTLNYNAGGLITPTVTPGLLPGEVLISIAGAGVVDAINYTQINITDPPTITPGPARTINSVEGFNLTDAIVGTFNFLPLPFTPPPGVPASAFTATIDWGDPSPDLAAATITQDASSPNVYDIIGTHTFVDTGTYTVGIPAINFSGATVTTTVGGVPVSFIFPASGPIAGTPATAVVTQGPLAVSAFPVVGTEGTAIAAGPIATFIDAGGADPVADYSASISITDSSGFALLLAGTITQNGSAASYTVGAPAVTLPEEGTYQVSVSVTDDASATPITVAGASVAVIADAAIVAGAFTLLTGNTGVPLPAFPPVVANFTDANTVATSDFTAVIDWGDGSANSIGTVVPNVVPAGTYTVDGVHTYAKFGTYTTTVVVTDVGGSTVTLTGSATVTDPAITGTGHDFKSVEGQDSGPVLLATINDPNTLATAADITAMLTAWGDGTPLAPVPVTVTQVSSTPTGTVFDIIGHHNYHDEVGSPFTFSITVTTLDPANPAIVVTGTATVADASLAGSNGTELTGVEGISPGSVLVGSFTDSNPFATTADFTPLPTIVWGDGSSSPADSVTQPGGLGTVFLVNGTHTYAEAGTYAVTTTVTDVGGQVTTTTASAIVADADLTAGAVTFTPASPITGAPAVIAGSFTDANTAAPATDFSAVIDWGDGSPTSLGAVTGAAGTYSVGGTHTYAKPGTYNTSINVVDDDGETVTLTSPVTAVDPVLTVTGHNFDAVEGADTGFGTLLATVIDPNPLATVADVSAILTTWGDGTPATPITVPLYLVGHTAPGAPNPGIIFEIRAGHKYHEEGAFTFSVTVQTLGTGDAPVTATGTANVADAALSSSNGTEITGIEGSSTGTVVLGTFHDANPFATAADFTATLPIGGWGDGTPLAPVTLTVTQVPTPPPAPGTTADTVFEITGSHTYLEAGTFAITINVADVGGSTTVISDSAIIADAPLSVAGLTQPTVSTTEAAVFPRPEFGKPVFTGPVAVFSDANPLPPAGSTSIADFTATIDWGDGTAPTAGTIVALLGGPTYDVIGSHTYADSGVNGGVPGTYPIQVFIVDDDGSTLTVTNTASVADNPIVLTGKLNPATDSGVSNTDAVTNVKQPDFFGNSEPFSNVSLFARATGGGILLLIGQVEAGSDGSWNIDSRIPLADGHYVITATAVDQFGVTTTTAPTTITPNLLIDTVGPVIKGVFFNRLNGEVDYTIIDPAIASGVRLATILDSANYLFTKVHANRAFPGKWIVTNIVETAGAAPNSLNVAVVFNSGAPIPGGFYLFTIRDSTTGPSTVQDIAGNSLDGEFYGNFPSGNKINGGDFVAMLSGFHNKIFLPQTIVGTANAANGGNGGPPVGAVHSGNFLPAVPVGGGSMFGSDPTHLTAQRTAKKGRAKGQSLLKAHVVKVHGAAHHAKVVIGSHPKGPLNG